VILDELRDVLKLDFGVFRLVLLEILRGIEILDLKILGYYLS
jgi:hypothetical protein